MHHVVPMQLDVYTRECVCVCVAHAKCDVIKVYTPDTHHICIYGGCGLAIIIVLSIRTAQRIDARGILGLGLICSECVYVEKL